MRRIIIVLFLLMITSISEAQFKTGNILVGGGIGYNELVYNNSHTKYKQSRVYGTVQFIYMIDSSFGAGVLGSYGVNKIGTINLDDYNYGLLLRYQFKWKNRFSPFLQLEAIKGISQSTQESIVIGANQLISYASITEKNFVNIKLNPGINFRISKVFYVNAAFGEAGYITGELDYPNQNSPEIKDKSFYLNLNFNSMKLGVLMHF